MELPNQIKVPTDEHGYLIVSSRIFVPMGDGLHWLLSHLGYIRSIVLLSAVRHIEWQEGLYHLDFPIGVCRLFQEKHLVKPITVCYISTFLTLHRWNPMSQNESNLIWIDLEMTGLDTQNDYIIEIATVVTDPQLQVIAEGPVLAIHQPDSRLDAMDEWNTRQHGQSGLIQRVKASQVTEELAQQETIKFLRQYVPAKKSPMCGNSICQDRRFLARCMPELEQFFHYRNLDVSTLKELVARWRPDLVGGFEKQGSHLALDDIKDSINELLYYRAHFIKVASA